MKGGYLIKEGIRSVWQHRLMSLASVAVLTCCLMLIGIASLFYVNINSIMQYIEGQNEMVVYVLDDADQAQQDAIQEAIAQNENIASYEYVDKTEALEEVKSQFGENADLLAGYEEDNPFPASYRIQLKDLALLDQTVSSLESLPGIEKINAPTNVADTLLSLQKVVTTVCAVFIAILVCVSLLIISNTIRITVFSRRREINIMKYVGATNWFIRVPFLVEGMAIGLIAALIAFGLIFAGYSQLSRLLVGSDISFIVSSAESIITFSQMWFYVLGGFILGGMGTGALGSLTSMQKHLEV